MLVTSSPDLNRISPHASSSAQSLKFTWADDLFSEASETQVIQKQEGAEPSNAAHDEQDAVACVAMRHEAQGGDPVVPGGVDPYYVAPSLFMRDEEAHTALPAYLTIFTLEELGMLYVFAHSPALTRQAALRMARNRGLDEDAAQEVVDFHFMRKQSGDASGAAPVERQADATAKPAARRTRKPAEAAEPVMHVLGEAPETVCVLALKGIDQVALRTDLVEELERSYPALDVRMELVRMDQWLRANPEKRKTPRGARRFINTWLSSAADRERMRRDMLSAGTPIRNGFGTGASIGTGAGGVASDTSSSSERPAEDGLGDFLA